MKATNKMVLRILSKPENERFARTACAAFLLELDPTLEEMSEIKTAISEAVTNSVIHGYDGKDGEIVITGKVVERTVTYTIKDDGCGIPDIKKAREPLYTGKPGSERSGMGFSIMEAFMDELKVESTPGKGTKITMSKRLCDNA